MSIGLRKPAGVTTGTSALDPSGSAHSLAAWVHLPSAAGVFVPNLDLWHHFGGTTDRDGVFFGIHENRRLYMGHATATAVGYANSATLPPAELARYYPWVHLCWTWDNALATRGAFYVNGRYLAGSAAGTVPTNGGTRQTGLGPYAGKANVGVEGVYDLRWWRARRLRPGEVRGVMLGVRLDETSRWFADVSVLDLSGATPLSGADLSGGPAPFHPVLLPFLGAGGRAWPGRVLRGSVAGGLALVALRSETVELAETKIRNLGLVRARAETVQLGEAILRALGMVRSRAETVELAESRLAMRGLVRARAETVELGETNLSLRGLVRARAETVQLSEAVQRAMGLVRSRAETVQLSEGTIRRLGIVRIRGETVQLAETFLPRRGLLIIRNETVQWVEGRLSFLTIALLGAFSALVNLVPLFGGRARVGPLHDTALGLRPLYDADAELGPEDGP